MQKIPYIFDIKRYSINDGPGIRITIFFKGCPLHCIWCHNPEGISSSREKMYAVNKCIGCGYCIGECDNGALLKKPEGIATDTEKCIVCGKCTDICPSKAMEMSGKIWKKKDLMKEIMKECTLIDSSEGGVTFCGGEPLLYPEFLNEMLQECGDEELHRAVDTTLFAKWETVDMIGRNCELFLVDLKVMDEEKHKMFTGVSNKLILENIRKISDAGYNFWIRIPLIEGVNADEENIRASAEFIASLSNKPEWVNILPYHDIAKGKHKRLGSLYNPSQVVMSEPTQEKLEYALNMFKNENINAKIGG